MELPALRENLDQAQRTKLVHWPTPQEYNEALQVPEQSFGDRELRTGNPELTALGLPRPITGMFASVYRVRCFGSEWAVRCFLHNIPEQRERYALLHQRLAALRLPFTVGFQYQENGIRAQGVWYPILKMQWCEGETLNRWIERNIARPDYINELAERWKQMILELQSHEIAHGDLQHGNVLVSNGALKLVDYDNMYTPEVAHYTSTEIGHRNYQHPGRTETDFGPWLDNFPAWVIYVSMKCLARDPSLWATVDAGDEFLLLSRQDLENPSQSRVFYLLENHQAQEIRYYSQLLRYFLSLPVDQVPNLSSNPHIPVDLPPVAPPQPEAVPDWVRTYDDSAPSEELPYPGWEPTTGDESTWRIPKRKRRRGRAKGGARAVYSGARLNGTGQGADPDDPTAAATSGKKIPTLIKHGPMKHGWSKWTLCCGILLLAICGYVVSLQINAGSPPVESPPAEEESNPVIFPALKFNAKGEANLLTTANQYYMEGDLVQACTWYSEAISQLSLQLEQANLTSTAVARIHRNLAEAQRMTGDCYYGMENMEEAITAYKAAADEYELAAGSTTAREIAIALSGLGLAEFAQADVSSAALDLKKACQIFDEYPRLWDEARTQCLADYASVLRYQQNVAAAEKIERRLKERGKKTITRPKLLKKRT